ncbi:hypothetical protein SBI67_20595 [Mycolicibacterium sp. 120266]|uniref:hypothetical protein n=1 Tax=Mycolicibacterium sp. 120266 TaxID=3090601 RepID=UPI00299F0E03|nr:hypothetical protein [Mycolicibacterium sp. 120266]MDX1874526.1 hypothetical protein [Mycolicibacterium sp. 120266]
MTVRESNTRPAGVGAPLCFCSAVCLGLAAVFTLNVWLSPEFAGDFDGGTHTAHVGGDVRFATGLLIAGAASAVAAIVRGGGHRVRPTGILLLLAGPAVAVLTLPLLNYYG